MSRDFSMNMEVRLEQLRKTFAETRWSAALDRCAIAAQPRLRRGRTGDRCPSELTRPQCLSSRGTCGALGDPRRPSLCGDRRWIGEATVQRIVQGLLAGSLACRSCFLALSPWSPGLIGR
jgi:hypothetical protein